MRKTDKAAKQNKPPKAKVEGGGIGTIKGVVTGVIIFTVINYGLTYIGVNPYWQYIIKGLIIVSAVALDTRKYLRKK